MNRHEPIATWHAQVKTLSCTLPMSDALQKFLFEESPIRGELVDLSETWKQVQLRRSYPDPVRKVLGEMLAAAALLSANLKFNGSIVMQVHGDGPLKLLVVECDSLLRMRATAKLTPDTTVEDGATLNDMVNVNGLGRFAITLDPNDKMPGQQAYQGIVPLDGDCVATIIENYMMRSEQLDTRLWLAADDTTCRGLLLQKLPQEGGVASLGEPRHSDHIEELAEQQAETWRRCVMLASTLNEAEMLSTDIQTLLRRVFWEETIRVYEPRHPAFHCSCSRQRVGNMLKMLGAEEVDSALAELGELSIDCDFCGQHYTFDRVDCAQLFAVQTTTDALREPGAVRH
jgi:molecular chaperone Hsp33